MTLPADLNVYVSAAMFVLGAFIFALYLGMIVWTVRDIRSRTRDVLAHILAAMLVALFTLPGLVIYMLLRPHTTLADEYERSLAEEAILQELRERRVCPGCRRRVEEDFIVCPTCHYQLRLRCVACGRLLDPSWDVCPYCGRLREIGDEDGDEAGVGQPSTALQPAVGEDSSEGVDGETEIPVGPRGGDGDIPAEPETAAVPAESELDEEASGRESDALGDAVSPLSAAAGDARSDDDAGDHLFVTDEVTATDDSAQSDL